MNYQFAPFRVGISDVTEEEMAAAKAKIKKTGSELRAAAIDLSLAVAEVSLRFTVNGMQTVANELADIHAKVALKQTIRAGINAVRSLVKVA